MPTVYLAVKTKNMFERVNNMRQHLNLSYHLKNIVINGVKQGCSGFIRNEDTGVCVYITTEQSCMPQHGFMYRYADNIKDSTGYHNRWTRSFDDLIYFSLMLLASSPVAQNEHRN